MRKAVRIDDSLRRLGFVKAIRPDHGKLKSVLRWIEAEPRLQASKPYDVLSIPGVSYPLYP